MGNSVVTEGNGVRAGGSAAHAPVRPGTLPPDVRRILIVGAGGFGREVLQWARDAWPSECHRIAGFLSADANVLDGFEGNPGIVSAPDAYRPAQGDKLLLAIGVPYARRKVAEDLIALGAEFLTLIHPTAIVAASARVGEGSILCPYAIASDSCSIGRFVAMNYHASLGHDASAGDFAVLSPYATLGGNAHIESDVFMGLHASVGPGKTVGARSKVSANSCVLTAAPADSIIFGVPGKISRRVSVDYTSQHGGVR
jgi:sugar O-acyltransferase (sialic acid O-acetyltransferase NeuD family)